MSVIESKELEPLDGFTLRVELHEDYDSSPADADCYDPEDVKAFGSGQWGYVVVVVKAFREGVELGWDSLGGVEYGHLANVYADPYAAVVDNDMPANAVEHARGVLARLCGSAAV